MKNKIKVSVILPVYNVAPYLKDCLDSVINQTLKEIEIICVDDGSTDKSLFILKEYEQRDPRIQVFTQENKGAGVARNTGLSFAKGEYLSFLDPDDFFDPKLLQILYEKAVTLDLDMVVCNNRKFHTVLNIFLENVLVNENNLSKKEIFSWRDLKNNCFFELGMPAWNKLFSAKLLREQQIYFQDVLRYNDMLFSCKALLCSERISFVPQSLVTYRTGTKKNSQATLDHQPLAFSMVQQKIREMLIELGLLEELETYFSELVVLNSLHSLKNMKKSEDFKLVYEKIQKNAVSFQVLEKLTEPFLKANSLYPKVVETSFETFLFQQWKVETEKSMMFEELWKKEIKNEFCFFGAGFFAKKALLDFHEKGIKLPVAICDNNTSLQGRFLEKIPILSLEEVLTRWKNPVFFITNKYYSEEIKTQILEIDATLQVYFFLE